MPNSNYRMSRPLLTFSGLLIFLLLVVGACLAGEGENLIRRKSMAKTGVKLGMIYSSRMWVDGGSNETGIGLSGGVVIDVPVLRRLWSGLAMDLHDIHVFDQRKKVLDLSLPVKYVFPFQRQKWELRAVTAAGFGYHSQVDFLDRSTYLTIKGGLEAVFHGESRFSMVADLLVISAPIGGNRDHRVTFGPTLITRLGFIY